MCNTAAEACSSPSTDNTPRIDDNCPGTGISSSRRLGSRKYWSICFSISDSDARNSCTTLPMVWRSLTRRYSSSIHGSSASAGWPLQTLSMRCASRATRLPSSGWSSSPSSIDASRHSTLVATSIASAGGGAWPLSTVFAAAAEKACASISPDGNSRCTESPTSENCSPSDVRRCNSPPATADQMSLAPAMRFLAWAIHAGSKRPRRGVS